VSVRDALTHMTGLAGSLFPGHPTDVAFAAALRERRRGMTLEGVTELLAEYRCFSSRDEVELRALDRHLRPPRRGALG